MDKVKFAKMLGLRLVNEVINDDYTEDEYYFEIGINEFCVLAPIEYMAWDAAAERVVESISALVRV